MNGPDPGTIPDRLRDLIDDGVTGLRLPPDDPAAWSIGLIQALGDEPWTRAAGTAARAVAARHDWPVIARRHVELYRQVIDRRS